MQELLVQDETDISLHRELDYDPDMTQIKMGEDPKENGIEMKSVPTTVSNAYQSTYFGKRQIQKAGGL